MTLLTIFLFEASNFFWGLLASILGSIIVVFLLFFFFHPRIKVRKEIALIEDGRMMFCFKNISLSSCFNISVAVADVDEDNNADETEAYIPLERNYRAYVKGCIGKGNDSEISVFAKDAITPIPSHLRIIISAQHAVSGLTSVTTHDFVASDAKRGIFEKGIFVPEGSTYAKVYTRAKIRIIQNIGRYLGVIAIIAVILFGCFWMKSWIELLALGGKLFILWSAIISLLYIRVLSRANAFSSDIKKTFNFLSIAFNRHENPNRERNAEDIVPND